MNNRRRAVDIHPLFWGVIAIGVLTGHFREIVIIFTIVLIHEWGHVAMAYFFHWRVEKVELLPFGGVAQMAEHGNRPLRENFWVVAAGPLQHVWMALCAYFFHKTGILDPYDYTLFMKQNTAILFFNLLPIWPLDGGKMLHIFCARILPYKKSLTMALLISSIFLLCLIVTMAIRQWYHAHLIIIILFLAFSHYREWQQRHFVFMRFLLDRFYGNPKQWLKFVPIVANENERLQDVLGQFQKGAVHTVIVEGKERVVYEESRLLEAFFKEKKGRCPLSHLSNRPA